MRNKEFIQWCTVLGLVAHALDDAGVKLKPVQLTSLAVEAFDRLCANHKRARSKLFREDPEMVAALCREVVALARRSSLRRVT